MQSTLPITCIQIQIQTYRPIIYIHSFLAPSHILYPPHILHSADMSSSSEDWNQSGPFSRSS